MSLPISPGATGAREAARQANGQFGTQPLNEVAGVELVTAQRTVASFSDEVVELSKAWDETDTHDTEFCDTVGLLGRQVLEASEEDRPGYDMVAMRLDLLEGDATNADSAGDVLFELKQITRKSNMSVVEDGRGGHTRLADGRPGRTCPECGNGYATSAVLAVHRAQDCAGGTPAKDAAYFWGEGKAEPTELPNGFTAPSDAPVVKTRGDQLMGGDTIWQENEDGELAEFKIMESIPDAGMWGTPHTYLIRDGKGHEDEYTFADDDPVIAHRGDGNPTWFDEFHAGDHWYWDEDADEEDAEWL